MNPIKVTKDYMERYALLSLIECYDERLAPLLEGKNENPDWQSQSLDIGLEVTEALEADDGRIRFVINQYFGQGRDGQEIKDDVQKKYPEYSSLFHVVDHTACVSQPEDMTLKINQVIQAIESKTQKLNGHYKKFSNNWLYIFAPGLFWDDDVPKVYTAWKTLWGIYDTQFDKVFINALDCLFILPPDGSYSQSLISNASLKKLKQEAQKRSD